MGEEERKKSNPKDGHPFPSDFHEFHSHKTNVKHDMFIKQFRKTQLTNVHSPLSIVVSLERKLREKDFPLDLLLL